MAVVAGEVRVSYRELNARKMFWVTLILSGVLFAALSLFGADDNNFTFLGSSWPWPMAKVFYKTVLLEQMAAAMAGAGE